MKKIINLAVLVFLFASLPQVAMAKVITCDGWQTYDPSKKFIENNRGSAGYTPLLEFDDETGEFYVSIWADGGDGNISPFRGEIVDYGNFLSLYSIKFVTDSYIGWLIRIDYHPSTRIFILADHSIKMGEIPELDTMQLNNPPFENPADEFVIYWGVCRPDIS